MLEGEYDIYKSKIIESLLVNNNPVKWNDFIGREKEIGQIQEFFKWNSNVAFLLAEHKTGSTSLFNKIKSEDTGFSTLVAYGTWNLDADYKRIKKRLLNLDKPILLILDEAERYTWSDELRQNFLTQFSELLDWDSKIIFRLWYWKAGYYREDTEEEIRDLFDKQNWIKITLWYFDDQEMKDILKDFAYEDSYLSELKKITNWHPHDFVRLHNFCVESALENKIPLDKKLVESVIANLSDDDKKWFRNIVFES